MRFEAGILLRTQRQNKGLSLEQIYEVTKISVETLQNIEEGKNLPAPIILKNFIKIYAKALNIDATSLLKELQKDKSPLKQTAFQNSPEKTKVSFSYLKISLIFLCLILIYFFNLIEKDLNQNTSAPHQMAQQEGPPEVFIEQTKPSVSEEPLISESSFFNLIKQKKRSFQHELMIQALEEGLMYIKLDDLKLQTQILQPKKWYVFKSFEKIYIRVEGEASINVIYNGDWQIKNKKQAFEQIFQ